MKAAIGGLIMVIERSDLSEKQSKILYFIESYLDENQIPPSVRDIQLACELSSTSVVLSLIHI